MAALDVFMWLLIFGLLLAIIVGYIVLYNHAVSGVKSKKIKKET